MRHQHAESIARCPTKVPLTRSRAIEIADTIGYPVIPYKCPNGWDHWHTGRSKQGAPEFHNHRDKWARRKRNQDKDT